MQIKSNLLPNEGIFFNGQVFDAYVFVTSIIKSAEKSIVLIDNYIDKTVLTILSKKKPNVHITFTLQKFNQQYPKIDLKTYSKS